jgi:chromosome partitioning protein
VEAVGKTIAVINQKGGVGKSTTVQALTAGLTLKGFKVLAIDLDPQTNTSYTMKASGKGSTILGVLLKEIPAAGAVQHTEHGDIIEGTEKLAGADNLITDTGKEYQLREALAPIKEKYDYIILDTPPALGILTVNALTASDSVIIPAQAEVYSLQGIGKLAEAIKAVKKYCNPGLTIEGILFTRYNTRSSFSGELLELAAKLSENLHTKVFNTKIRESIDIKKAQATQSTIYEYAPRGNAAEDYNNLIGELIQ